MPIHFQCHLGEGESVETTEAGLRLVGTREPGGLIPGLVGVAAGVVCFLFGFRFLVETLHWDPTKGRRPGGASILTGVVLGLIPGAIAYGVTKHLLTRKCDALVPWQDLQQHYHPEAGDITLVFVKDGKPTESELRMFAREPETKPQVEAIWDRVIPRDASPSTDGRAVS